MRKLSKILVLVLALAMMFTLASMFTASATNSTDKWYVAGESGLCGSNWSNNDPNNLMTYQDGTHVKVYEKVPAGTYQFKCVKNANWDTSWGTDGSTGNASVTVDVPGSTVTITVSGTNTVTFVITPPAACDHEYAVTNPCVAVACVKCGIPTSGAAAHTYGDDTVCDKCGFDHTQTHKVYFKNTANWSAVTVHNWSDAGGGTTWPGTKMEKEGDLYVIELPAGRDKLIFNNNNGGTQTADLPVPSEPMVFNWETKAWEAAPHVCDFVAGEVVAPTYTAGGYTVYTCSGCGATENRDETPAKEVTFPEAVVTPVENPDLTFALNFTIKGMDSFTEDYIEALFAKYGDYYADYRLTITGLTSESVIFNAASDTADGYLSGQYNAWSENWVNVPAENVVLVNGESIWIMETAAAMMGQPGLRITIQDVAAFVKDFNCGVYFTPEFLAANPDMVVTLELVAFAEVDGVRVDTIPVAENVFTVPHEHVFVDGECECGEKDPNYVPPEPVKPEVNVSDLVAGTTTGEELIPGTGISATAGMTIEANNKSIDGFEFTMRLKLPGTMKVEDGAVVSGIKIVANGPSKLVVYAIAGNSSATDRTLHLTTLVDGALVTVANGDTGMVDGAAIAKYEIVIPEAGTYYLGSTKSGINLYYIAVVDLPAHEHTWVDATCVAPKTCSGCGETEGEALPHTYFYNLCLVCYAPNPYFENNFTTVGENKLVCNEWHLVESEGGHGKPYQFTFTTIPEDGLYIFTADPTKLGVFIYTIPYDVNDPNWETGGANWNAVTFGQAELKAGTYYLGFIFYEGVGEYDLTITKHEEHSFAEGVCTVCGAADPTYVPPHEHNFVEGKCECGETDPNYVAPQEPVEELNFFQKILAWFMEIIRKLVAIFKK